MRQAHLFFVFFFPFPRYNDAPGLSPWANTNPKTRRTIYFDFFNRDWLSPLFTLSCRGDSNVFPFRQAVCVSRFSYLFFLVVISLSRKYTGNTYKKRHEKSRYDKPFAPIPRDYTELNGLTESRNVGATARLTNPHLVAPLAESRHCD